MSNPQLGQIPCRTFVDPVRGSVHSVGITGTVAGGYLGTDGNFYHHRDMTGKCEAGAVGSFGSPTGLVQLSTGVLLAGSGTQQIAYSQQAAQLVPNSISSARAQAGVLYQGL